VLPGSDERLAVAVDVAASVAGGLTVSEEGLTVLAGVVASEVCAAERLREWPDRCATLPVGALAVGEVGLTVTVGATASSGALTDAEDGLTGGAGTVSAGVLTGAEDEVTVEAGAASTGALTAGEGGVTVVGALGSAPGVLAVGEDGLALGEVGLVVGAGACANPNITNRAHTTIDRNTFFTESS
jgi:hypothetical protein